MADNMQNAPEELENGKKKGKKEKKPKTQKEKALSVLDILIPVVCGGVILFSGFNLFKIYRSYAEAEAIYDGIALYVRDDVKGEEEQEEEKAMEEAGFPYLNVDFDSLAEINEDFLGWLYFPLLDISYPVVRGDEAETYLHEAMDGTKSNSGCIYIDYYSNPYLKDMATLFFGHNMRNGSMFGSLKRIRKEEGLVEQDPYFYYYTPTKAFKCHIFCYYLESAKGKTYECPYDVEGYDKYMDYILEKNEWPDGPSGGDIAHRHRLVTLSTCSGHNSGKRTVIQAVIEDTYEYSNVIIGDTIDLPEETDEK